MSENILKIKETIKLLASEGRSIHEEIRRSAGLERHALWNKKREVGRKARAVLLLYGLLRGVPYHRIEPRCREHNGPGASWLLAVLREHLGESQLDTSESEIKDWLEAVPSKAVSR